VRESEVISEHLRAALTPPITPQHSQALLRASIAHGRKPGTTGVIGWFGGVRGPSVLLQRLEFGLAFVPNDCLRHVVRDDWIMTRELTFGRTGLIEATTTDITGRAVRRLVTGPSGIGKTTFMRAVAAQLRAERPDRTVIYHEIASPVASLDTILGDLAAQIAEQTPLATLSSQTGHALLRGLRDHPFALASAALLDVATHLLPQSTKAVEAVAAALTEEVAAGRPDVIANDLVAAARKDLLGGMVALLEVLSANDIHGVLMLDAVDQASDAVRGAVSMLLRRAPLGWTVVASINDETPPGIAAFNAVWPEAAASGVERVVLEGLDENALERWTMAVRGEAPTPMTVRQVLANCDGRPLYLADWVEQRSEEAERGSVTTRLGPYYETRLHALPEGSRRLARQLSLLPTGWVFPLTLCSALLETSDTEALAVIDELVANHFVEPVGSAVSGSYRFVHEVAHQQIRASLPGPVEVEGAATLLAALAQTSDGSLDERYAQLRLALPAGRDTLLLEEGVDTAQALTEVGSMRPADELLQLTLSAARAAKESTHEAEARLGIAQVFLDTGYYEETLTTLETVDGSALIRPGRRELARGQALIRLNRYEEARSALVSAADTFDTAGDVVGALSAQREENTILRDLELYDEAVGHARELLQQTAGGPPLLRAACHRALARSLALAGAGGEGLDHARQALDIAEASGSTRAAGNAHLAAGECLRHTLQLADAITEYRLASSLAEALANRDSLLWAQLGLADALLLADRVDEASAALDEVGAVVASASNRYPLEFLHWDFSREVIEVISGAGDWAAMDQSAQAYERFDIRWPRQYLEGRRHGAMEPKKL
jgi:tetratricopeptide (TPR) repeat protein